MTEGYEIVGKVCQLKRSIYGLKQAPRAWYSDIDQYLCSLGFMRSTAEPNLYILSTHQLYLILYVDDILIFSDSRAHAEEVRNNLSKKYKMTDLGLIRQFLGLQVICNRRLRQIFLHQTKHIDRHTVPLHSVRSCSRYSQSTGNWDEGKCCGYSDKSLAEGNI